VASSFYPHLYETALALLIKARVDAGLTEQELARRLGQAEAFVLSYESGRRLLDPAEFIAICRAIGVEPYALLGDEEQTAGGPADEDQPDT
jgi:transcriptional regulator with XRE-family HTH domain